MSAYSTATAQGFVDYHTARGRTVPGTWDNPKINASLLNASEWIDNVYGPMFVGLKTDGFLQDREWPRKAAVINDVRQPYVFAPDAIPERITHAVYEAAWRDASVTGSLQLDYSPRKYKRVSIDGAISVDYNMFSSAAEIQSTFPIIDQILSPLLREDLDMSYYSGAVTRV